jgi:lipid-A-disaccharide synthase
LPVLLDGARRILAARPTAVIVVGLADSTDPTTVEGIIQASGLSVRIVRGRTPVMMRAADLLLAVSGTVTLEAAILGTPMLIVYRLGFLSWLLARLLVRVRFIGLPNLVADASVVPELIQFAATPERIAATAQEMLGQPGRLERMRQDLAAVRQRLGEAGAADRAAVEVLRLLGRDGGGRAV